MEKKITKIELADGKIIAFRDEDTNEIRVGISDDMNEENMLYISLKELKENIKAIEYVKEVFTEEV